jgi:HK97 gp10 family phage protein
VAAASGGISVRLVVTRDDLPKVQALVAAQAPRIVTAGGYAVEAAAKAKAPVLTGTLRRSIHTVISLGGLRAVVGPSVGYGADVELGTRHMAARPYLRPAYELVVPKVVDQLKALLRRLG